MNCILLLDRDPSFRNTVAEAASGKFHVLPTDSIEKATEILASHKIQVALIGISFLEGEGIKLIGTLKKGGDPHLPVIVLCNQGNLDQAPAAMRCGAYDFVLREIPPDLLFEKISRAVRHRELEMQVRVLTTNVADRHDRLVFSSDAMKKINFEITRLANQEFDVLLTGETGVGKDLIAFELHQRSPRAAKPFVTLPLRSLSETLIESELFGHERGAFSGADATRIGKLEAANHGTLYIPEISSLTHSIQLKLLHFLQYKTIVRVGQDSRKPEIPLDVRVIFATNEDLGRLVAQGIMREDFYYRISGVRINIPPLRERPEDIEPLTNYFLSKYSGSATRANYSISPELYDALRAYRWPGNVRELENCVKQMLAMTIDGTLKLPDSFLVAGRAARGEPCRVWLENQFAIFTDYAQAEAQFKRAYFSVLLEKTGNNIPLAAKKAGMTPQGFRKALRALKLDKP